MTRAKKPTFHVFHSGRGKTRFEFSYGVASKEWYVSPAPCMPFVPVADGVALAFSGKETVGWSWTDLKSRCADAIGLEVIAVIDQKIAELASRTPEALQTSPGTMLKLPSGVDGEGPEQGRPEVAS